MKEFFHEMPYLAWSLVLIMLALAIVAAKWEQVKWWAHNTWYSFPLVGRVATLSKSTKRDTNRGNWFVSEKNLCEDYYKFLPVKSEYEFMEAIKYLKFSGDSGRSPLPIAYWILNILFVIAEALGFSYVLAGFTVPGASENTQQMAALGLAFVISALLIYFAHESGKELYKSKKIDDARREWEDRFNNHGVFRTQIIGYTDSQSLDDDQPICSRLVNRAGDQSTYKTVLLTIFLVLAVAIGATYVRVNVLEKQLQEQITGKNNPEPSLTIKIGENSLNFSGVGKGINLPINDAKENSLADKKALDDSVNLDRHGGWGTFAVLAVIFIFLQGMGVRLGYRYSFAGNESEDAYKTTGGYKRYALIRERYDFICNTAQSKLSELQQRMMHRNSRMGNTGVHTTLSFREFLSIKNIETEQARIESENASDEEGKRQLTRMAAGESIVSGRTLTVQDALSAIENIPDKDARIRYVTSLVEPTKAKVITELKRIKEEKESALLSKENKELDGLL
jgi:hypothetical protein